MKIDLADSHYRQDQELSGFFRSTGRVKPLVGSFMRCDSSIACAYRPRFVCSTCRTSYCTMHGAWDLCPRCGTPASGVPGGTEHEA